MCAGYYVATLLTFNKEQFKMKKIRHAEQNISIFSPINEYNLIFGAHNLSQKWLTLPWGPL